MATTAAALACGLAYLLLYFPTPTGWMGSWKGIADLYLSLWIVLFALAVPALWGVRALVRLARPVGLGGTDDSAAAAGDERPRYSHEQQLAIDDLAARPSATRGDGKDGKHTLPWWWALALLAICSAELVTHSGERNGWVASSEPTSGVETWTTADGYSILLDGIPAQGDGRALLPMLSLFAGDGPPEASEFDRRAGHVYLVSLLQRPLGVYWSFAAVNLLGWWAAALAVWWLGRRRWPGTRVPWLASLFVATGQGFIFVGAAPQAHGPALASFALVLALCDALQLWQPARRPISRLELAARHPESPARHPEPPARHPEPPACHPERSEGSSCPPTVGASGQQMLRSPQHDRGLAAALGTFAANWAKAGWAVGAAGLIYLAHVPALLFLWLYTLARARERGAVARTLGGALLASLVALAIVQAWQIYAAPMLGLRFAGGNNDLAREAARNWFTIGRHGVADLVGQMHAASARGLLGAAFYYPWWLLAIAGFAASGRDNRRWALAIIFAAGIPAIAFSTRFTLPRIAYFMFPAVYLLAARGLEVVAKWSGGRVVKCRGAVPAPAVVQRAGVDGRGELPPGAIGWVPNAVAAGVVLVVVLGLIVLSNVDLAGNQQLNLWFHYSQGNGW